MNLKNIPIAVLALPLIVLPIASQAAIKCWVNKDGVKECGDKVPPEYAQEGHKELSERGFVVDEKERAKSEEELEEERRQEALKAEEERLAAERERRDQILLQTFSSVSDLEKARDDKLLALESTISIIETRNEKIQADLDNRIKKAADEERAQGKPSDDLLKDIEDLRRQITNNNQHIAEKRSEQEELKETYARDIERFKELKSVER